MAIDRAVPEGVKEYHGHLLVELQKQSPMVEVVEPLAVVNEDLLQIKDKGESASSTLGTCAGDNEIVGTVVPRIAAPVSLLAQYNFANHPQRNLVC
jgi:hypothetical protein